MRIQTAVWLVLLSTACERQATEPCAGNIDRPVLELAHARGKASDATIPVVSLSSITLDGLPIDTVVLRNSLRSNAALDRGNITCTLPCSFGRDPGLYRFEVFSSGFYRQTQEVAANYTAVPSGCPASQGTPTQLALSLVEADSARLSFGFVSRIAGYSAAIASVTFDDGSGPITTDLRSAAPLYTTRNTGTLQLRFVVGAPDTLAVAQLELPLKKDNRWGVVAFLYNHNPKQDSFCIDSRSFPLRRAVAGIDSLYIAWIGSPVSVTVIC